MQVTQTFYDNLKKKYLIKEPEMKEIRAPGKRRRRRRNINRLNCAKS